MRNRYGTSLAALLALLVTAAAAHGDEEKISAEKLPAAVKKAVKKKFPEARIRGASKEVEDDVTTYEVELKVEGRSVDMAFKADGTILEIEKEVPVSELPKAVRKKLAARYPGAKIERAEEIIKGEDGPVRYEVAIKAEVVLTAKGKIVKAEEEDEDDEKPAAKSAKKKEKEDEDDDDD
jgi:Putative beta-lactamase-inhibitor-like, PepSY-like